MSKDIYAQVPAFEWARATGGAGAGDAAKSIAVDRNGNTYTVGDFNRVANFDRSGSGYYLTAAGSVNNDNVYIVKHNSTGTFLWAKSIGVTNAATNAYGVDVDDSGNVYVIGVFGATTDFDPGPAVQFITSYGSNDIFMLKLDSAGNFRWVCKMGGNGIEMGTGGASAIFVSKTGDAVYGTGGFRSGIAYFGQDTLIHTVGGTSAGEIDAFITKIDAHTGDFIWTRQVGGQGRQYVCDLKLDTGGHLYAAGYFRGITDFDPGPNSYILDGDTVNIIILGMMLPQYADNPYVLKWDTAGNFIWAKKMGGKRSSGDDHYAIHIDLDLSGNVYLAGSFKLGDTFRVGPYILQSANSTTSTATSKRDVYFAKMDTAGNFLWARQIGLKNGKEDAFCNSIAMESTGAAFFLTGEFYDTMDFDPGPNVHELTSAYYNMYLAKMDTAGHLLGVNKFNNDTFPDRNTNSHTTPWNMKTDQQGNVYISGWLHVQGDFDPHPDSTFILTAVDSGLTGIIPSDGFIVKLFDCIRLRDAMVTVSGPDSFCPGDRLVYTTGKLPGATAYIWTLPDGTSVSDTTSFIEVTLQNGGSLSVRAVGYCDSSSLTSIQVRVSITAVMISVSGDTLGTVGSDYDTWQWYKNGQAINGATGQFHIADENVVYSVVVTKNGCTDTAEYNVTNVGVHGFSNPAQDIRIYPNPVKDILYIISSSPIHSFLTSMEGKTLLYAGETRELSLKNLPAGIYLLHVSDTEGRIIKVEKITKH